MYIVLLYSPGVDVPWTGSTQVSSDGSRAEVWGVSVCYVVKYANTFNLIVAHWSKGLRGCLALKVPCLYNKLA